MFLTNLYNIEHLEETLEIIPHPGHEVNELLDNNQITNQKSLVGLKNILKLKDGPIHTNIFDRVYFGNEICENLIPQLKSVERAYELLNSKNIDLTFVSPYVSYKGIQQLKPIFSFLNALSDIEVVVNDYAILYLINEHFPNLKPVLGRLLNKMKRDPRYTHYDYDIAEKKIKNPQKVADNQNVAASSGGLENKIFQEFLRKACIERVSMDAIPKIPEKSVIKKWNFPVDLYWPWTYITSGRNCAIAAHTQPGKLKHCTDEPCNFQCKKFEFVFESDKTMFKTVQRGMAVWMNSTSLLESYANLGIDRLVYQPYIPV